MSVARGAEQREQQPGEVGDRNDVHLEDVAQLVAREVREAIALLPVIAGPASDEVTDRVDAILADLGRLDDDA